MLFGIISIIMIYAIIKQMWKLFKACLAVLILMAMSGAFA